MDERLAQRVRMFREGGHVPLPVVEFVVNELHALAAAGRCVTEDTAGMLTSHLMMALTRLAGGQPAGQSVPDTQVDAQVTAELRAHPEAVAGARAVAARACAELGIALPEPEIGFLGLHLAVLAQRSYVGDGDIDGRRRQPMTRILTGGLGRTDVARLVQQLAPDGIDVAESSDMDAASELRSGRADYYLGTCHTGAGASLGVLVGVLGSGACHTFGRAVPRDDQVAALLAAGVRVFGFAVDRIEAVAPVIVRAVADAQGTSGLHVT